MVNFMPDSFIFISQYFWLLAIIVTCLNAFYLHARSRQEIANNPALKEGYTKIVRGYLFYFNLPWLGMGIGMTIGHVPTVFHFFQPREGNPFVIAFHLTSIAIGTLGMVWVYLKGGAEFILKHQGIFSRGFASPLSLKLFLALSSAGGVVAEILAWVVRLPDWIVQIGAK